MGRMLLAAFALVITATFAAPEVHAAEKKDGAKAEKSKKDKGDRKPASAKKKGKADKK